MNSIKGNYARHVAVYDDSHREAIIHSQLIVSEMNRAMEQRQFHVYLQPKFNMETEKIIGAEALVRWVHPENEEFCRPVISFRFSNITGLSASWISICLRRRVKC